MVNHALVRPIRPHPGRLIDFREQLTSVEGLAGISQFSVNLTGGGEAERLPASSVSSGFLTFSACHRSLATRSIAIAPTRTMSC